MVRVRQNNVQRKPWGKGKAAEQKYVRNRTAFEVAELLKDRMDLDKVEMTGQLFPRGSLKKKTNKELMDWVHMYKGRLWTLPMLKQVVRVLTRTIHNFPLDPSKTYGAFVKQQAKRLGQLVRQAKRIKDLG